MMTFRPSQVTEEIDDGNLAPDLFLYELEAPFWWTSDDRLPNSVVL